MRQGERGTTSSVLAVIVALRLGQVPPYWRAAGRRGYQREKERGDEETLDSSHIGCGFVPDAPVVDAAQRDGRTIEVE
jgi:hypothetical protein